MVMSYSQGVKEAGVFGQLRVCICMSSYACMCGVVYVCVCGVYTPHLEACPRISPLVRRASFMVAVWLQFSFP